MGALKAPGRDGPRSRGGDVGTSAVGKLASGRRRPLPRRHRALATLLVGCAFLAWSLRTDSGTAAFGAAWVGWGSVTKPGRAARDSALGVIAGALLAVAFAVGLLVDDWIPPLATAAQSVSHKSEQNGAVVLLLALCAGVGEELFFRGALWRCVATPALSTTALYTLVTEATGNVALVLAALVLGVASAALRWRTNGVLASITLHVTWSVALLLLLPRLA